LHSATSWAMMSASRSVRLSGTQTAIASGLLLVLPMGLQSAIESVILSG